jgi:hypothetical protein
MEYFRAKAKGRKKRNHQRALFKVNPIILKLGRNLEVQYHFLNLLAKLPLSNLPCNLTDDSTVLRSIEFHRHAIGLNLL